MTTVQDSSAHPEAALEECVQALERKSPALDDAIRAAVTAWRVTRAPAVADLVDRLSERRAEQIAEVARVTARTSVRRAPEVPPILRTKTSLEACWKAAEKRTDDPRSARALVRVLFEPRMYQGARARRAGHVEGYATKLVELGDVRVIEPLRALLDSPNAFPSSAAETRGRPVMQRALAALEAKAARLEPLSAPAAEALARVEALVPRQAEAARPVVPRKFLTRSAADAVAAVFASPHDEDLRRICGDRLQEQGDPRGELIALQFAARAGRGTKEGAQREKALLHKNAGHWSGAIAPIGTRESMRFDRGFLAEIALEKSSLGLNREMWDAALESPYWATVERLIVGERVPDWWLRAWLASPHSARVRELCFRPVRAKVFSIVLSRPEGAPPGALFRLAQAKQAHPKLAKALSAMSREQIEVLRDGAPAMVRDMLDKALAAASRPAAKPKRAAAPRPKKRGA